MAQSPALAGALLLALSVSAHAAPTDPDETFGVGGVATIDLGDAGGIIPQRSAIYDMLIQPDGRIVAIGAYTPQGQDERNRFLVRYLLDGLPDTSFGDGNGVVKLAFLDNDQTTNLYSLGLQTDGKYLLCGQRLSPQNNLASFFLLRLTAEGAADATFGTNGIVYLPAPNVSDLDYSDCSAVAQRNDELIVTAGYMDTAETSRSLIVALFDNSGRLVDGFGTRGIAFVNFDELDGSPYAFSGRGLIVRPDDGVYVAGGARVRTSEVGSVGHLALASLDRFGELDPSFGSEGRSVVQATAGNSQVTDIAASPDGSIVAVGVGIGETENHAIIARLTPGGALDPDFAFGGFRRISTNLPSGGYALPAGAERVSPRPDGSAIVLGSKWEGPESNDKLPVYYRILPDGDVDSQYGLEGTVAPLLFAGGLSTQENGEILLGGTTDTGVVFTRLNGSPDGPPQPTPQPTPTAQPTQIPGDSSSSGGGSSGGDLAFVAGMLFLGRRASQWMKKIALSGLR